LAGGFLKSFLIFIFAMLIAIPAWGQWEYGGKAISGPNYWTANPIAIPDGQSGIFVAWRYYPQQFDPDIYVQHVDSAGYELWRHEGVPAEIDPHGQYEPCIVPDGQGGVIVAWSDLGRNGSNYDIYAQRISASGQRLWGDTGLPLVIRGGHQMTPFMVSDGEGGAILAWSDQYLGYSDTMPAVIQRVDSLGNLYWGEYGMGVTPLRAGNQVVSALFRASDDNFIICWIDARTDSNGPGVYAQKFTSTGQFLWGTLGAPILVGGFSGSMFAYQPDLEGGLYCFWTGSSGYGAFLQFVDGQGSARLGSYGIAISSDSGVSTPCLVTTSDGRAIIAWNVSHSLPFQTDINIVDTTGAMQWPGNYMIGNYTNRLYGITQSEPGIFELGLW
jgi:hypothetical protein